MNQNGEGESGFAIHIFEWVSQYTVKWNGQVMEAEKKKGYIYFRKLFSDNVK